MTPDIRKERETALYEAALRLIAKGVNPAAMKVQQIADEAGIGKGTVYEYFASKDEILQGMALYCFDTEIARIAVLIGGDYMLDVNMIIANNIQAELKKENKKQVDLAEGIGVSKQTMSKIMNGARAINAIELHKISEYLHVSMDSLMKMPEKPMDTNVIHAFMGRVKTEEARKGIRLADELSDMILFHTRVCENGKKMEQPWEDK